MKKEENEKNSALIYAITKENINRLINSIKLKAGKEDAIREIFGKGKFIDTKRALISFNLINEEFQFTAEGRKVAYGDVNETQRVWFNTINAYDPYSNYIQSLLVSTKINEIETVNVEDIINYWGMHDYGTSANNRREAVSSFAAFVELAGIGEYKIGRHGAQSRITFFIEKIKEKMNKNDIESEIDVTTEYQEKQVNNMSEVFEGLNENEDEKIPENINSYRNNLKINDNVTININIDMSNWQIDDIERILNILK